MKIIKPGKEPKKSIWKGTCMRCGLMLEAGGSEVAFPYSTDPAGGPMFATIGCPHCRDNGHAVDIMLSEKRLRGIK